ncbi:ceramidase domain-containing protein [Luteipulveratus halotolerans]|uniref:Ceramidase n=1 Tax=Luteipulveratus halotolerans TaxID=1631356 RepID=A0A0L6CP49_9MICO|nr:ceramidase domain-containing protein [Luteipulveratus halotolerans]KNX39313.1 hypothetical protein VV01_08470 [Luteipulveratus halotolerans]
MNPSRSPVRPLPITAAVAAVSLGLLVVAAREQWLGPADGSGAEFCEAARDAVIRQPANTASNLGFVVAGLLIAYDVGRRARSLSRPALLAGYGCLVVLLGPGSMAMHATESATGGLLDLTSMYLVAGYAAAYALTRLVGLGTAGFSVAFVASVTLAEVFGGLEVHVPVVGHPGNLAFAVLLVAAVVMELVLRRRSARPAGARHAVAAVASMLVAFGIWNISRSDGPWCSPQSWLQGHAVWHLLGAVAAYELYRYYASERPQLRSPARLGTSDPT